MINRRIATRLAIYGSAIALAQASGAQLYKDPAAPLSARVSDLVGRMTLDEKAAQMQNAAPAIPRLGIPPYDYWNEALHGVARAGEATVFPQAIGMAATWDADLLRAEGRVVAVEGRAKYNKAQREGNYDRYYGLTFWSPNINIFRDPRWGRGQETLGEDPYLSGTLGTEFILGVQGDHPKYFEAIATPKHFAVHSGPEPLRHDFNVNPSPRDLSETYLPQFRRAIIDGKAYSLMCAYNAVDGKAACANGTLLGDILRRDWGFKGFVTSDCGAIDDITTGHRNTKTNPEGAALAVRMGTDSGCDFKDEMLDLPKAVRQGYLKEADMDVALKRLFTARMRLGMFDPPEMVPFSRIGINQNHSEAHKALSLRAARESIVLLKNERILPLARGTKIAVVGPTATSLIGLEGNYNGTPTEPILPLDGVEAAFGKSNVTYAQGSPFTEQVAVPVPRTAFPNGLQATFYNSADFSGPVVAKRTDKEIDFNWASIDPAPGVDRKTFSVRWTGKIAVPAPGDYALEFESRRECRPGAGPESYTIHVEGAQDLAVRTACDRREKTPQQVMTVHFADTTPRNFRVEFTHAASAASDISLLWKAPLTALREEAVRKARDADVVVAFVGLNAWLEGEEMPLKVPGFDGGDRTSISLPGPQLALLDAVAATGKPLVVVLQSGSAIALGADDAKARAILAAWYPGEQGGQAIGEVLRGSVNPSGRLPVTFYKSTDELPPFTDYSMKNRTYRYFTGQPEYAFGHGLSYTTFAYSTPTITTSRLTAGKEQTVSVRVRNTGKVAGDEVAQLYISTPGVKGTPLRSLKGYQRVHLNPGQTKTVSFRLTPRDLAFADAKGVMRIVPTSYKIWVGGGQPGTGAPGTAGEFAMQGNLALPR